MCASLALSACLPMLIPTPLQPIDLPATDQILALQTSESLASSTIPPSSTPNTPSSSPSVTSTKPTATETQNPILLTLTATLGTGTATIIGTTTAGTLYPLLGTATPSATRNPALLTPSQTSHPQFYGTLPPYVPSGKILLVNKSDSDVYISLQVTTTEGLKSILEYPVDQKVTSIAPAGKYFYVAWVGGKKITGSFRLDRDADIQLNILKDKIVVRVP
jgi:hypothetical protein